LFGQRCNRLRRKQQRLSGTNDLAEEWVRGQLQRHGCMVVFIGIIRKAHFITAFSIKRNQEIGGRQQRADDLMELLKEGRQIFSGVGGRRNGIERGLHGLDMLALGDVMRHSFLLLFGFCFLGCFLVVFVLFVFVFVLFFL